MMNHFYSFFFVERIPGWCPKRSTLDKSLILISILSLIGIISVALLSIVVLKIGECKSKESIFLAVILLTEHTNSFNFSLFLFRHN